MNNQYPTQTSGKFLLHLQTGRYITLFTLFICIYCFPIHISAQTSPLPGVMPTLTDSTEFDPEQFTLGNDFIGFYTKGWFPRPFPGHSLSILFPSTHIVFCFDRTNNLRPRGIGEIRNSFTHKDPFADSEHREFAKAGVRDDLDDDYPESSFNETGFVYQLHLPIPLMLRTSLMYRWGGVVAYAPDNEQSFLGRDGQLHSFQEVRVLALREHLLCGSLGITIPLYGVFADLLEQAAINSYYYFTAGISADYVVSSKASHYFQIADVKNDLRYASNQTDTTQYLETSLLKNGMLPDIARLRPTAEFALGWSVGANATTPFGGFSAQFSSELFARVPLIGYLTDNSWSTIVVGVRILFGYQWLFR